MHLYGNPTLLGVFNLGSGVGMDTMQLVKVLSELLDVEPIIQLEPARQFEIPAIVLDLLPKTDN